MKNEQYSSLTTNLTELGRLILGMRSAYSRGENVMEYARNFSKLSVNLPESTMIAYDLQAGSYIEWTRLNNDLAKAWCKQLAELIKPYISSETSLLEVGCGEATTLTGVLQHMPLQPKHVLGFDISWSRCSYGLSWLMENHVKADLFVADLFSIPLEDDSIDVVYTSHSLEPNGGREEAAIKELIRIAKKAVILVEPIYELAPRKAQERMKANGYVRGLYDAVANLGGTVREYKLLEVNDNPLNPSGVLIIEKQSNNNIDSIVWRCPLTFSQLMVSDEGYFAPSTGVFYPILSKIPVLRKENAIIASAYQMNNPEFI